MLRNLSSVDQGLVEVANNLLVQLHVPIVVESLEDINANVFVTLFEGLYGEPLSELLLNPQTKQDDIHNCQIVIDTLANKILHTSLSHITGKDVVEGDRTSVANLLEILTGLLEFLTEKIECEQEEEVFHDDASSGNQDDIDQLMEGIRNLPRPKNTTDGDTENDKEVKASWEDFKNSENSKSPEPDLLVGDIKTDDDPHNLTFSIPSSVVPPLSTSPIPEGPQPPPPLPQEDKSPYIESLPVMDLPELNPMPPSVTENEALIEKDQHAVLEDKKSTNATSKVWRRHIANLPPKKLSKDSKNVPSQPKLSSKGNHQSKENLLIKLPRHEDKKKRTSPSLETKDLSPEEATELLKTYSNNRTTDELLDMIDVTLKQLDAESRPSASLKRAPHKKQVHFEEPSYIKKVKKTPVSLWHHKQGDWKKNKKLKFIRRNYAEDLAELTKDVNSQAKSDKTAANEKEKELLKITGGYMKFQDTAMKKKTRKPNMKARVYNATKEVRGEDLLPALLEEFPHLQLSMETWHELWRKSIVQLEYLTRSYRNSRRKRDQTQQQVDDAEKRQHILYDIIKKEIAHAERMKEMKESKRHRVALKNRLHEKRMTSARARKYYNEFSAQMRSRMMSKKTKEELIFKRLFQDSLQIQRERIQELQNYLQEIRHHRSHQLQNEIDSMENFYHDQFKILTENMKHQKAQKMAQEAAQTQLINTMKRDLRKKMEEEVRRIQEQLCQDEDEAYFRELDAERVKRELQLANYVFKLRPRSYLWNSDH